MKSTRSANKSKAVKPGTTYRRLTEQIATSAANVQASYSFPNSVWECNCGRNSVSVAGRWPCAKALSGQQSCADKCVPKRRLGTRYSKIGLSQDIFAALPGVSPGTLRGWEQGRRQPNQAARVLLRLAARHPEALIEAAKAATWQNNESPAPSSAVVRLPASSLNSLPPERAGGGLCEQG